MFVGSRRMRFQSYHDVDLESNSRAWWIEQSLARWYKCRRDRVELASPAARPIHLFSSWLRSFSKNRRPHSDQRCAFFNRDREILRHPHRELRKIDMKLRLQASAQLAQLNKIFPRSFGFLGDRRDRHKPQDRQSWQREQRFHFCAQLIGLKAELTPLACYIDLKQNSWMQTVFFGDAVDVFRERERIDAVSQFKQRERMTNLIFLEMPHEMPAQVWW